MASRRKNPVTSTKAFASAAAAEPDKTKRYTLRLFVAGTTPGSILAVENLRAVCEEHLAGRYDLEVVDVYQNPALARDDQVVAVPTLVKKLPAPLRRILGDLSDRERVLVGLDLQPKTTDEKKPRSGTKKIDRR